MKNGLNKKLLFLIAFLLIGMMFVVYVTYAYYNAEVSGNESESTVAVTGGSLTINYQNNSGDIKAEKIMPGWSATKNFTITATIDYNEEYETNFKIWYDMLLVIDRNDFLTGSLEYMLSPINSDVNKEGIFIDDTYKPIPTGTNTEGISMGSGYLPNDTTSHTYNLSLRYLDRDDVDQTPEMEGKFYARVNVKGSNQSTLTIDLNGGTLSNFSLDSSNKTKIAKDSEIYIPSPIKVGYYFLGWEIVNGTGTITGNNLVVTSSNITIKANYREQSFANDTWEEIATAVRNGNTDGYKVGETREITLDGITNTAEKPTFTIRIANKQTPESCKQEGFSQTACGFVLEFAEIIALRQMNPSDTNVGGWPATTMRTYLNEYILDAFPVDLKNVIIDTYVVSGHGSSESNNFTSTDMIYLLSGKEVFGKIEKYDTLEATRQLEYYVLNGLTNLDFSAATKNQGGTAMWWWCRAARSNNSSGFTRLMGTTNNDFFASASTSGGVSPAFRIG